MIVFVVILLAGGLMSTLWEIWRQHKQIREMHHHYVALQSKLNKEARQKNLLGLKSSYFESIMRNNLDPIFTTDPENLIMRVNQGAIDLFGYLQDEVLGKPVEQLFYDHSELARMLKKVETKGSAHTMEIRGITATGRIVHLNLSIARMDSEIYGGQFSGCVFNCQDITKRKAIEREMHSRANELEKLALTDALTGLFNRRQFEDDLGRFTEQSRENPGQMLTLLVLDLDKFKQLNDTFGHPAGDQALRQVAEAIRQGKRDSDPAYRFGGDEFIVIIRSADSAQAEVVAERIQSSYRALRDENNHTSVSIGLATFDGTETPEELFQRSDTAMYRSKTLGGNRVSV